MPRYGRVEGGYVIDVYTSASSQEIAQRLGVTGFILVPDETKSGDEATPDGQGGYSFSHPAAAPAPPPIAASISQFAFIELCMDVGGMSAPQLVACKSDPGFAAMWIMFGCATSIDRDHPLTQSGLHGLDQAGYLPNHAAAVLAAWPTA